MFCDRSTGHMLMLKCGLVFSSMWDVCSKLSSYECESNKYNDVRWVQIRA